MLKRSSIRFAAQAVAQERFDRILQPICKGKKRLGLAISGGVDSMALASLCSKVQTFDMPPVTAFVVDHCLRPGSTTEAKSVASNLRGLGIRSEVLTIDWPDKLKSGKLSNLETAARKLRFQILGRACARSGIDSLLLAHHADDQAETVLSRINAGYLGIGLQGIQASSPIPECHGIYKVSGSGSSRNLDPNERATTAFVASGGVVIHRPLLDFTKVELIATCQARQVQWHEDATNADKTLTARNAIRHLLQSNNLPSALSPSSLTKLAASKLNHRRSCEDTATAMFKACNVEVDTKTSSVSFWLCPDIRSWLSSEENPNLVAALLTRKFLSLSEDQQRLQLQDLSSSVEYIFPFLFGKELSNDSGVNIGNVTLLATQESDVSWSLSQRRTHPWRYIILPRPVYQPQKHMRILLEAKESDNDSEGPVWTPPQLFHDRWWIKLQYIPANLPAKTSIIVRFLNTTDLADMRASDPGNLDTQLKLHAPANARFTLPAIVERSSVGNKDGSLKPVEIVWALPSIGWTRPGFSSFNSSGPWRYTSTYKNIEFETSSNHTIKTSKPYRRRSKSLRSN